MPVRGLLARIQRLEQAREPISPFERWLGSLDAFHGEMLAGIDSGEYDPTDMPVVIAGIDRWHWEGIWARLPSRCQRC